MTNLIIKIIKYLKLLVPPIVTITINKLKRPNIRIVANGSIINSFSQYSEDLIIDSLCGNKSNGFYVDVGAHRPDHLSNTLRFYQKGWCGINIEPQVNLYQEFVSGRERDINLNMGVHREKGELIFYHLEHKALSTFDYNSAKSNERNFSSKIVDKESIPVCPLKEIFANHLHKTQEIDFISIDTEGNELNVLNGNDWDSYRPKIVIIEYGENEVEIYNFFKKVNYDLVYKNNLNAIYYDLLQLNNCS